MRDKKNRKRSLWSILVLICSILITLASTHVVSVVDALTPGIKGVVVVTGATGKVGSRLVKQLLQFEGNSDENQNTNNVKVVALVRNASKARSMFQNYDNQNFLEIIEADFEDPQSLEYAFSRAVCNNNGDNNAPHDPNKKACLFLACGNVPNQLDIELNIARAASASATPNMFCVKLSTAEPLVQNSMVTGAQSHKQIEAQLPHLFSNQNYAILRPNVFYQMLDPTKGGPLFGIDANQPKKTTIHQQHLLAANQELAMIDCEDVAACAKSILLSVIGNDNEETTTIVPTMSSPPTNENDHKENSNNRNEKHQSRIHHGKIYELTGPKPKGYSWTKEFRVAVNKLRSVPIKYISKYMSVREGLQDTGMPEAGIERMEPFISTLNWYNTTTDTVEELLSRKPRSLTDFVMSDPTAFLPKSFQRLLASGKSDSFRSAASPHTLSLQEELDRLEPDEILVRVQSAGVNGGANTFSVTNASEDAKNFPLGAEATGIVVAVGRNVLSNNFRPGDTAVLIAAGTYGEYVRADVRRCTKFSEDFLEKKRAADNAITNLPGELAALRISGLTALVSLERTCPVQKGDVVLVTACCGGTGHFAIQIAKNAGATVIGTVGSTQKVQVAKDLGCIDRIVDLSRESLNDVLKSEYPQGIDICYEGVGGKLLKAAHDNMANGGRILVVGSISQYPHNTEKDAHGIEDVPEDIMKEVFGAGPGAGATLDLQRENCKLIGNVWGDAFTSGEIGDYNDRLYELYGDGKIKALLDPNHVFLGVDSICDAVDHMLSRKSIGKVTATISSH